VRFELVGDGAAADRTAGSAGSAGSAGNVGSLGTATVRQAGFRGPITRITAVLPDGTEVLSDVPSAAAVDLLPGREAAVVLDDAPVMVV
jgi:hypothetical protein